MKKVVTISLSIFVLALVAVFSMWLGASQNKNLNQNQVAGNIQTAGQVAQITLNEAEVAKHNLATDCWTIVRNKVYNLTSFASLHSGGVGEILKDCGKDGTLTYDTKGGKGQHKAGDINILANYYVGDLGQTVSQQAIEQNVQKSNTVPAQNFKEKEDEYEYEDD